MANNNNNLAPETNDTNAPSFLNYSRGFDTGASAVGQAIGSFGDTVGKAIGLADRYNVESIKNEVRQAVETLDTRYIGTTLGPNKQPLPEAAQQQIKNLEKMKAAAAQGKISQEHYYSVLQVRAKEIRTKYGDDAYADEIDKAFTGLLGTTPAEAMRKIVAHQAQQAQASAQHETRHNRDLLDAVTKGGLTMRADLIQRAALPGAENDPKFMAEIRLAVGKDQAYKQQVAQEIQLLNLKKSQNEDTADTDQRLLNGHAVRALQGMISAAPEYKDLVQLAARVRTTKAAGGVIDPQMEDNLRVMVNAMRARAEGIKNEVTTLAAGMPGTTSKTLKEVHDFIDNFVNSTATHITNKEYGLVGLNAASLQGLKDSSAVSLLQSSESARKYEAYTHILGPQIWSVLMNHPVHGPALLDPIISGFSIARQHDMMTQKNVSLMQHMSDTKNLTPEQAATANTKDLGDIATVMTSATPPADRNVFGVLSSKIFSPEGKEFMARIGNEQVRNNFYLQMASPAAYNNVKSVADLGRPDVMRNYKNFVADGFAQLMRKATDAAVTYNNELHTTRIKYNPETRLFELQNKVNESLPPSVNAVATARDALTSGAKQLVDDLNTTMYTVNNFAKISGEKPESYAAPSIFSIGKLTDPQTGSQEYLVEQERQASVAEGLVKQLMQSPAFTEAVQKQDPRKAAAAIGRLIGIPTP